jgi:hypothetical protein
LWVTKDGNNLKIKKNMINEYLCQGYTLGRYVHKKPPSQKGKIWVTNGLMSKLVNPNEMPDGFLEGKFSS